MSHRDPVPTPPILPDRLGASLSRLQAALGRLRAACRPPAPLQSAASAEPAIAAPAANDPHRLAAERDAALARAAALQAANTAALLRLDRAESSIAAVMRGLRGRNGGEPRPAPPGAP